MNYFSPDKKFNFFIRIIPIVPLIPIGPYGIFFLLNIMPNVRINLLYRREELVQKQIGRISSILPVPVSFIGGGNVSCTLKFSPTACDE